MIAAVGIAALARGRWRAALLQVVPLAAVYTAWLVGYGRGARTNTDFSRDRDVGADDALRARSARSRRCRSSAGRWPRCSSPASSSRSLDARRSGTLGALTAPGALGARRRCCSPSCSALTRFGLGAQFAASSRYLHIVAALVLPALAVAADALARRWRRRSRPSSSCCCSIGVPGNIAKIGDNVGPAARYREQRRVISALPRLASARERFPAHCTRRRASRPR